MTLMKKLGKTSAKTLALAVVLILSAGILMAEAEEYIIGPDDVLDISNIIRVEWTSACPELNVSHPCIRRFQVSAMRFDRRTQQSSLFTSHL